MFGELTHGEAAYLHDLRGVLYDENGEGKWRRNFHTLYNGNLYPTHGLGPVAQYMGIHGGDKFEYLVSMSSLEHSLSRRRDTLGPADPRRHEKFVCGDMNVTLIKTALGRTIMVQHDVSTPRPYSRINAICGTKGSFCDYPPRIHVDGQPENWDQNLAPYTPSTAIRCGSGSRSRPEVGRARRHGLRAQLASDALSANRPAAGHERLRRGRLEQRFPLERGLGEGRQRSRGRSRFHPRTVEDPAAAGDCRGSRS